MSVRSDEELSRIGSLEAIRRQGKEWDVLAPRYGVTNPNPPWKTSLIGTNECLAAGGTLPALDRRRAEDELGEAVYRDVPAPERELLALVHTMLSRGLLTEGELAARMSAVRSRSSRKAREAVGAGPDRRQIAARCDDLGAPFASPAGRLDREPSPKRRAYFSSPFTNASNSASAIGTRCLSSGYAPFSTSARNSLNAAIRSRCSRSYSVRKLR